MGVDNYDAYRRWKDVMPCYLSVQDRALRIVETNNLFQREFGERLGEFCYRVYKDRDRPCPSCPVLQTFADGQVHAGEEAVVDRDGRRVEVVVTSAPLFDAQGRVHAVVEMSTDITEVKTLRRELARTRRDYKRLFDAVPGYICVLDRDLNILEANTLYQRDFDLARGTRCFEACKGRSESCPECLVEQTFADGQVRSSEERLTTRDGRQLELVVYSMPIRDDQGDITAVMEVFTDITEVKRLQRQLTLMGRAVAGMAHRIKNILMGLEGGTFVVNTGMQNDDQQAIADGWEMVERNVGKVSRLVKDLLYCSKKRQLQFRDDVAPAAVLREVHALYERRLAGEDIQLQLEIEQEDLRGRFDPDGLHNMLSNLVANAVDACRFDTDESKQGHHITLCCRRLPAGGIVLEVSDDGAGIPEDVCEKVFEDFFSTKGNEGTGIGLLVVQKVAEEHGGSVRFSSRPGRGTTFYVELPLRGERASDPGKAATA